MTNEELDRARAEEAAKRIKQLGVYNGSLPVYSISAITEAARLGREGWTPPPVVVDPDIGDAVTLAKRYGLFHYTPVLDGIKRGRELERAEAKPGLVWVKHDFATAQRHPARSQQMVCVEYSSGSFAADFGVNIYWPNVTHYAIITPPAENVA